MRASSIFSALLCFLFLTNNCQNEQKKLQAAPAEPATSSPNAEAADKTEDLPQAMKPAPTSPAPAPTSPQPAAAKLRQPQAAPTPKGFTDVIALDPSIRLDIRYATTDNFTKAQIYDCPRCLLRTEAAEAVVKAHKELKKKGLGFKMFDCYRPRPYQQRLWDKVPNPDYVTPPAKGSMHSRGAAVDLTIVDAQGKELDMGTPYDFFGPEAHSDNLSLPAKVLNNRQLLRETLSAVGFKGIRTEWWHFSFQGREWPLSDYVWPCNGK
jgi:D-alanyl-D-alanine dipeptidase